MLFGFSYFLVAIHESQLPYIYHKITLIPLHLYFYYFTRRTSAIMSVYSFKFYGCSGPIERCLIN